MHHVIRHMDIMCNHHIRWLHSTHVNLSDCFNCLHSTNCIIIKRHKICLFRCLIPLFPNCPCMWFICSKADLVQSNTANSLQIPIHWVLIHSVTSRFVVYLQPFFNSAASLLSELHRPLIVYFNRVNADWISIIFIHTRSVWRIFWLRYYLMRTMTIEGGRRPRFPPPPGSPSSSLVTSCPMLDRSGSRLPFVQS